MTVSRPNLSRVPRLRPVSRGAAVAILLLSAAGTAGILYPKVGAALLFAVIAVAWATRTVRDPITGVIGAFFFYPICALLRSSYGAYHLPVWAGGVRLFPDFALALVFAGLIVRACKTGQRFRIFADDVPVFVYLLSGVYGFILAAAYLPLYGPMNGWWVSMTPAVFYFAIRFMRPTEEQVSRLLRFFFNSYALLAFGSFYQYIFRPEWLIRISNAERPYFAQITGLAPDVYWRLYTRMESLLLEENVWGTLCSFVALYCLAGLQGRKTSSKTVGLLAISLLGMALSMSRGALLTWGIGVIVLLLLRGRHRGRILAALVALGMVGGFVMSHWGSSANVASILTRADTLTSTDSKNNASSDRIHQWRAGWEIFVHNPSGIGLGTVGYAAHLSGIGSHRVADGIYFRILAETGVPGAVMTLYALIGTGWVLFRHIFDYSCRPPTRRLGMALFAFHCGFVVQSIGANTYDLWYLPSVFWTFFGVFVSLCSRERAELLAASTAKDRQLS
jgi:hypothetical protein